MESGPLSACSTWGQDQWVVASVGRALGVLICSLRRWAYRRVLSQNHLC